MDPFNLNSNQTELDLERIEEESFGLEHEELLEDDEISEIPFDAEKICIEQRMLSLKYMKAIQQQLSAFLEVLEMLTDDETVNYSFELYDQVIFKDQSLAEWLYSDGDLRDEKNFFN